MVVLGAALPVYVHRCSACYKRKQNKQGFEFSMFTTHLILLVCDIKAFLPHEKLESYISRDTEQPYMRLMDSYNIYTYRAKCPRSWSASGTRDLSVSATQWPSSEVGLTDAASSAGRKHL